MIPLEWVQLPPYRVHLPLIGLATVRMLPMDDITLYLYYGVSQRVIDRLRNECENYDDGTIRYHCIRLLDGIFQDLMTDIVQLAARTNVETAKNIPLLQDQEIGEPMVFVMLAECGMIIEETDTTLELTCVIIPYTVRFGKRNHLYFSFLLPEEKDRFLAERERFIMPNK